VNLGSDFDFRTSMKASTNPIHGATITHMQQQLLETLISRGKDH
jgi:hypothetical protein